MKRKIKFRGYDTADGVRENVTFTLNELLAVSDDYELVDADSVAQLIGVDKNGFEVYEGDLVIRIAGDEDFNPEKSFHMAATFEDFSAIRDEEIVLEEGLIKIRDRSRN